MTTKSALSENLVKDGAIDKRTSIMAESGPLGINFVQPNRASGLTRPLSHGCSVGALFKGYTGRFAGTPIKMPFVGGRFEADLDRTAVHIQPVLLPQGTQRRAVMERMKQAGIQTSVHYPPAHLFTAYREQSDPLPRTEALAARELTLPLFPTMTDQQVDLVVESLLAALH